MNKQTAGQFSALATLAEDRRSLPGGVLVARTFR
jgi:hypothetical protein